MSAKAVQVVAQIVVALIAGQLSVWLRSKQMRRLGYQEHVIEQLEAEEHARRIFRAEYDNRPRTYTALAKRLRVDAERTRARVPD